nr:DUF4126 domain-containing protein [Pseudactinotalea sp. HY160]
MELLTGGGLALAAGLNAFIPLLAVGLLGRYTDLLTLPAPWEWLTDPWALAVMGLLLLLDVVADKVPAVDHLNDIVQTGVRPASGGIVFASGATSTTVAMPDPDLFDERVLVPFLLGVAIALLIHLIKSAVRAMINLTTAGLGAPVASAMEDATAVALAAIAIMVPILVVAAVVAAIVAVIVALRRRARFRRRQLRT